jgi:hypothetical protein
VKAVGRFLSGVRSRPVRRFRIHVGLSPAATASFVLYEDRGGGHHWEWVFDHFHPADPTMAALMQGVLEYAVTKAEERLALPFTFPPDHWTHRPGEDRQFVGWPWDSSVGVESAEEALDS